MAESDANDDQQEHRLVMPFVVCQSQGGPYDDTAFVAGYTAGTIDAALHAAEQIVAEFKWMVSPDLIPQLDLLAMRYGFDLTHEPWDEHPDEWTEVTITKATGGKRDDS